MAKPILLIKVPKEYSFEELLDFAKETERIFDFEYHVLAFHTSKPDWNASVLNAERTDEVDIEELKHKLLDNGKTQGDI